MRLREITLIQIELSASVHPTREMEKLQDLNLAWDSSPSTYSDNHAEVL